MFLIVYFMGNNRFYSSVKMKLTVFFGKNTCFGSMIMLLVLQSLLRRNFFSSASVVFNDHKYYIAEVT